MNEKKSLNQLLDPNYKDKEPSKPFSEDNKTDEQKLAAKKEKEEFEEKRKSIIDSSLSSKEKLDKLRELRANTYNMGRFEEGDNTYILKDILDLKMSGKFFTESANDDGISRSFDIINGKIDDPDNAFDAYQFSSLGEFTEK